MFIVIIIIAMVIAFYHTKKGYDSNKLDKMIDLFKYSIGSVSIATVAFIISNSFKEREQQIKELEYFDKYVEDVKKADGLQGRYELTKYLSIVAPNGELKKSRERYYDTLKIEYQDYLQLKNEKQLLDSIKHPTKQEIISKKQVSEKIEQKNLPLSTNQTKAQVESKKDIDFFTKGDLNPKTGLTIRGIQRNSEILSGYIYDAESKKPVSGFTVFFNYYDPTVTNNSEGFAGPNETDKLGFFKISVDTYPEIGQEIRFTAFKHGYVNLQTTTVIPGN